MTKKILIIQTAFIGDVVLATPVIEAIKNEMPDSEIDFLLRKGNEALLHNNPKLHKLLIWNKKDGKYKNLLKILKQVRKVKYDYIVNLQRFASTGIFTVFSNGKVKIGFKQNPFSFGFTHKIEHIIGDYTHETNRNLSLLKPIVGNVKAPMKLYPTADNYNKVEQYQRQKYICAAPTSVWFTKQYPFEKWCELFKQLPVDYTIYLLGAPSDSEFCNNIISQTKLNNIINLCGKLNLLESAALMEKAAMNYVNDSAPMHLASAVNAPTTAIFCSTIPAFGFGPLAHNSAIVEVDDTIECRPCGLHGKKECPEGHYKCGFKIDTKKLADRLQ